nr:sphingolipid delta(4)-desaturase DES1-like [Tanacetum cinerariifolium]
VGFHNEHHDMPSIPWNNLPKLKQVAPEFYEPLLAHTSYTKLFFKFLFDQEISLYSRITRRERGTATLRDQSVPDRELFMKLSFASLALVALLGAGTIQSASAQKAKTVMVGGAPMYPTKNIVENAVNSKDHTTLAGGGKASLKTVQGETLTAMMKGKTIELKDEKGGIATVTIADVMQSNGVIHVVNKVLMP